MRKRWYLYLSFHVLFPIRTAYDISSNRKLYAKTMRDTPRALKSQKKQKGFRAM